MPAINPNDYNIDSFNSQNLGPITVTDFRNYVLTHNLPGVDPNVASLGYTFYPRGIFSPDLWNPVPSVQDLPDLTSVSFIPSPINNNTSPRPDNLKQNLWTRQNPFYGSPTNEETFETIAKSLEDPGSIDNWIEGNGFEVDVTTVRNMVNLSQNEYGPDYIFDYSSADAPYEVSGYEQYPSSAGGDVLGPIIGRTLGFSTNNFIDFPSELQTVARERRVEELENRIKLNFVEDTVGKINLDPLGLLGGQSLFTPNYTITRPKSFLGKAAEFTANLAGFNIPTSIIPGSKTTTQLGSNAFQDDLLDYTGKGQRDLLYANVYSSKYTPELLTTGFDPENEDTSKLLGKVGDFFRDLGKQSGDNYLKISKDTVQENQTFAQKVGNFVNDLISPNAEKSLIPTPEKDVNPPNPTVTMGLDGKYPAVEGLDDNSRFNNIDLDNPAYFIAGAEVDYYPNKTTMKPSLFDSNNSDHQTPSANQLFDWRDRDRPISNRGLLKFTQDMINNAEANGHRGGAKYIGRFNSDSNLVQAQKDIGGDQTRTVPKHSNVSMGNLVRSGDDTYYCRSWSTRNPYQNHYDLIRSNSLYRGKFVNDLSVLEDNGHVKIAPYADDKFGVFKEGKIVFEEGNTDVKRYMFSIENLAWLDAPERVGLQDCQLGPNGGRIMWFPPYDINFTDNTSINWESNNFIGRAEPIFTYNNTDRKGTLSFSVITDHPSVINQMKKDITNGLEEYLYKFFAGCGVDISDYFGREVTDIIREEILVEKVKEKEDNGNIIRDDNDKGNEEQPNPEPVEKKKPPFDDIECFFRNARRSEVLGGVRRGVGRDISEELAAGYEIDGNQPHSSDKGILNLNQKFKDDIDKLIDFLATKEGQNWGVEFIGYTSGAAPKNYNKVLAIDRAQGVYRYVVDRVRRLGVNGVSTSAVTYTYNKNNDSVGRVGFVCKSTAEQCAKATENSQLDINDLKIVEQSLEDLGKSDRSQLGRWIINAQGEYGSDSKDDEDATYGNNDKDLAAAKKDRKVKLVVFPNMEYEVNSEIVKLEPKKAELLPQRDLNPLNPITTLDPTSPGEQTPEFTISFEDSPVTDKLGTAPTLKVEPKKPKKEKPLESTQNAFLDFAFNQEPEIDSPIGENAVETEVVTETEVITRAVSRTVQRLFTECDYFIKIKKEDPFVYDSIAEKIKYFHPAFHAITPEGFNERLTFLHQCTRQGPSMRERAGQTQNMAFGRPPICVLRIGDFYYTKIVIDSLNINYDPLQWDMNPEGIGVQPQIAKIDINFSFIGGSSLDGPIRQLQNAVSFNFFANTAVYNPRRYFDADGNENLKSLEELLKEQAEKTIDDYVGFGAFKTQKDADSEIFIPKTVSDSKNENQDEDVNTRETNSIELPLLPIEEIDGTDTPQDIDRYITYYSKTLSFNEEELKEEYEGASTSTSDSNLFTKNITYLSGSETYATKVELILPEGSWTSVYSTYSIRLTDREFDTVGGEISKCLLDGETYSDSFAYGITDTRTAGVTNEPLGVPSPNDSIINKLGKKIIIDIEQLLKYNLPNECTTLLDNNGVPNIELEKGVYKIEFNIGIEKINENFELVGEDAKYEKFVIWYLAE